MAEAKCQLCNNQNGIYKCPRCNILYCSVSCYKSEKHVQCSESFYEKCVQEELSSVQNDPSSSKRMLEILKRTQEDSSDEELPLDSDDENPRDDLSERLANVDLDDSDAVWDKLTIEEQKEFKKLLETGNITDLLPEWEPWWKIKSKKILDVQEEDDHYKISSPSAPSDIPPLSKLTRAIPSPSIPSMISNVLLSYVFTCRWFKGKHQDMPIEAVSSIFSLSATLRCNQTFGSMLEAYIAFENDLKSCSWVTHSEDCKHIANEDLISVLQGPGKQDPLYYVLASLSDLHTLLLCAAQVLKQKHKIRTSRRFTGEAPKLTQLRLEAKKISYYMSWTKDCGHELERSLNESLRSASPVQ